MATFAFASVAELFGVGTTVGAYLPATNLGSSSPVSGAAIATAVVQADGSLTFTGLVDDTAYVAYDSGSGRRRRFRTKPVETRQGVVVWDGTGGQPARPSGFVSVEWVCPVDPAANALNGDTWVSTA